MLIVSDGIFYSSSAAFSRNAEKLVMFLHDYFRFATLNWSHETRLCQFKGRQGFKGTYQGLTHERLYSHASELKGK